LSQVALGGGIAAVVATAAASYGNNGQKELIAYASLPHARVTKTTASRATLNDPIELRWSFPPELQGMDLAVYAGTCQDPATLAQGELVGVFPGSQAHGVVADPTAGTERIFFLLLPRLSSDTGAVIATGRGTVVAERGLRLEGHHNLRDLGGLEGADGRRVRYGMLYRHGTINAI